MPAARTSIALILLTALAGVLRFAHLERGLPQTRDPDAVFVGQALQLEARRLDGDTSMRPSSLYPHVLGHLMDRLPGRLVHPLPEDASLEQHLEAARRPDLVGRRLSAGISTLAVPATYALARPFLMPGGALCAAAFTASSLLHQVYSRQARPHGPLGALCALALLALLAGLRRPSAGRIALAAALCAMAVGTLHNGSAILIPALLTCVLFVKREGAGAWPRVALATLILLGGIAWSYPFAFDTGVMSVRENKIPPMNGAGFERIAHSLWSFDPVLLVLAGVGALLGLRRLPVIWRANQGPQRERRDALLLWSSFAVPLLLMNGVFHRPWHRFSIPHVPFLALLAAGALALIAGRLARGEPRATARLGLALALVALALPGYAVMRFMNLHGVPDTRERMARWIEENLDESEPLLISPGVSLPLAMRAESMARQPAYLLTPWQRYVRRSRPDWSGLPVRDLGLLRESGKNPGQRGLSAAGLEREIVKRGARYLLLADPVRVLTADDETLQLLEDLGAQERHAVRVYRSEYLSGSWGGRDQFDFEALRFGLRAQGIGPELRLLEIPEEEIRRGGTGSQQR